MKFALPTTHKKEQNMREYEKSITNLKGVGSVRAAQLEKAGIKTVRDLLYTFPRAYQDRGNLYTLAEAAMCDCKCAMYLTVGSAVSSARLKNGRIMQKFTAFDKTGKCTVTFFNNAYVRSVFKLGDEFRFFGKLERLKGGWYLSCPEYEKEVAEKPLERFFPIYPLSAGLTHKFMQSLARQALNYCLSDMDEILPDDLREKLGVVRRKEAFSMLHNPKTPEQTHKAATYFVIEEMYRLALSIEARKRDRIVTNIFAPKVAVNDEILRSFESKLPFVLTNDQRSAVADIRADLEKGVPMKRIIIGDVGCGKTVCAAISAYICTNSGYQCALMAPTEILARQHFEDFKALLDPLGITCELLVGSLAAAEKKRVRAACADGSAQMVIGTHALFSQGVAFKNPCLAITDEQHRFGVNQREMLLENGGFLHTLYMSATPIPRTLALSLFGDMDISRIGEMPKGRIPVSTFLVDSTYRERMNGFIAKQAEQGLQVYVVCPAIEPVVDDDGDEFDFFIPGMEKDVSGQKTALKNATEYAEELRGELLKMGCDAPVGCLHGRMKGDEKEAIMGHFVRGEISVLVSTTVIEVGVNVPRATLMIIENAERFGLSQLHQLRGRVGRGAHKSWCILVSDTTSEKAKNRLEHLCRTRDGYEIAKYDLKSRGPGDFLRPDQNQALRQSGSVDMSFTLDRLSDPDEIVTAVFDAARRRVGG